MTTLLCPQKSPTDGVNFVDSPSTTPASVTRLRDRQHRLPYRLHGSPQTILRPPYLVANQTTSHTSYPDTEVGGGPQTVVVVREAGPRRREDGGPEGPS